MEDCSHKTVLHLKISKKLIDSENHQKKVLCVIYFGLIQWQNKDDNQVKEEFQWALDQILQINFLLKINYVYIY